MDLSIYGHRFVKNGGPIDIPTDKNRMLIACDGEQDWAIIHTRQDHLGDIG